MLAGFRPRLTGTVTALTLSLTTVGAHAQAPQSGERRPKAGEAAGTSSATTAGTEDGSKQEAANGASEGAKDETATPVEADEPVDENKAPANVTPVVSVAPVPEATPPLEPTAQTPSPVPLDDAPEPPSHALEFGAFVGIANRPSEGEHITYGPAVAWGIYARPEIRPWLGIRLYYREESIPVTVEDGGFDTKTSQFGATSFQQSNLHLRSLGMAAEPTWVVTPRLRLMAVVGIAWLRFTAPAPSSSGEISPIYTAKRSGVELDFIGGLGASFELIPDWFAVGARFAYGVATDRTGNAHQDVQAFNDGKRFSLGALPRFDGVTDLLFTFGLIL